MARISHTQFMLPAIEVDPPAPVTPASVSNTPTPALPAAVRRDVAEVLGFCPRLLSDLPAPVTLVCERVGAAWADGLARPWPGGAVIVTTSAPAYAALTRPAMAYPVFVGTELAAMALAAEHDRGTPAALEAWCDMKLARGATWRLTAAEALGVVAGVYEPRGWMIARVFRALGLVLHHVEVGDDVVDVAAIGGVAGDVPLMAAGAGGAA